MTRINFTLGLTLLLGLAACDDGHVIGDKATSVAGGNSAGQGGQSTTSRTTSRGGSATQSEQTTRPTSGGATGGSSTRSTSTPMPAGGTSGGVSALDENCTLPATQFEFTVDDTTAFCSTSGSAVVQVEILTPSGSPVSYLTNFEPAVSPLRKRCPECGAKGYYADLPRQGAATGFTGSWSGDREEIVLCDPASAPGLGQSQCGIRHCVDAGRYVARYCVAPKDPSKACEDAGSDSRNFTARSVCVDVPFDFPSTTVVRGIVTKALIPNGGAGQGGSSAMGGSSN